MGVKIERKRWQSVGGRAESRGLWFVLPQTYMNLSGGAVAKALRDTNLTAQEVWVVHDELDLPLCRMRIRRGGSGASHYGDLSIINALGTLDSARFRVGLRE